MQIQTAGATLNTSGNASSPTGYNNAFNERVFRVFRNSVTATTTITAGSFARGNPAILATGTVSENGYDCVQGSTAQSQINNLLIGVVYDYPDTTIGRTGVMPGEAVGLAQCYGYMSNISISVATKTSTLIPGVVLIPGSISAFVTYAGPVDVTVVSASSISTAVTGGVGGLVYNMSTASMASVGTVLSETGIHGGFIRCM